MKELFMLLFAVIMLTAFGVIHKLSYLKNIFVQKINIYNEILSESHNFDLPELERSFSYEVEHYAIDEDTLMRANVHDFKYTKLINDYILSRRKYKKILALLFAGFFILYLLAPKQVFT